MESPPQLKMAQKTFQSRSASKGHSQWDAVVKTKERVRFPAEIQTKAPPVRERKKQIHSLLAPTRATPNCTHLDRVVFQRPRKILQAHSTVSL